MQAAGRPHHREPNDLGIIDLPGDAGHVVAVVYIKRSEVETYADREPVIAQIARAIHDYFVFNRE